MVKSPRTQRILKPRLLKEGDVIEGRGQIYIIPDEKEIYEIIEEKIGDE